MKKNYKITIIIFLLVFTLTLSACSFTSKPGKSAYEIAIDNGFIGTETEWLQSLKGANGTDGDTLQTGKSAYEIAIENGFVGSESEWLSSLIGANFTQNISLATNHALLSTVSVFSTFTYQDNEVLTGSGSGVIYSDNKEKGDAYIITNFHVIYDASSTTKYSQNISVFLYGMKLETQAIKANLVGGSNTYDIAVLKISNSNIYKKSQAKPITIGNSDNIYAGDITIAIGNPQSKGTSVTTGIISVDSENINLKSSIDESQQISMRVIRIDAAVNPGNSGGGLFDENGHLIGIVNAKKVADEIEGIGYAIPSNVAINIAKSIINNTQNNKAIRTLIGITIQITNSYSALNAQNNKIDLIEEITVTQIDNTSVAKNILQIGDVIKSITYNNKTIVIDRMFKLTDSSLDYYANTEIVFSLVRGLNQISVSVTPTNSVYLD